MIKLHCLCPSCIELVWIISIANANVTMAKTKWSHKSITNSSLQLSFCCCLAVVINSFSSAQVINQSIATMGIEQEIKQSLEKFKINKIESQPTNKTYTKLHVNSEQCSQLSQSPTATETTDTLTWFLMIPPTQLSWLVPLSLLLLKNVSIPEHHQYQWSWPNMLDCRTQRTYHREWNIPMLPPSNAIKDHPHH